MSRKATRRRVVSSAAGTLLVLMAAGCTARPDSAAAALSPSPVQAQGAHIVAVMHQDGVLLRAVNLQDAQQIEGIVEWTPENAWYESFEGGRWWFDVEDWEWLMVPNEGRMVFGLWRGKPVSGDGVLGVIRFRSHPSVDAVRVWVDGHPVEAEAEDQGTTKIDTSPDLLLPPGTTGDTRGARIGHRWFVVAPPQGDIRSLAR